MSSWIGSPGVSASASGSGKRTDGQSGFTLIETLVAFIIAIVLLGALLPVFRDAAEGTARADAETRAVLLAESLLDGMIAMPALPFGEQSGELPDGLRWRTSARPFDPAGAGFVPLRGLTLVELVVTVAWRDTGRDRSMDLATIRLVAGP
jgi:general secretion pathway protein I